MKPPRQPLFVARATYRSRRRMDAARLLPVLGIVLVLLPLLWSPRDDALRDTAVDGIYIFAIWALLVGVAAWLAPGLGDPPAETPKDNGG